MSGEIVNNQFVSCKFDETRTLFASVIIALDSHQVNVTAVNSSESDINTSFTLESGNKVSVLTWLPLNEDEQVLAIGLTNGSILLYSPSLNTTITRLSTSSNSLITDVHFSYITNTVWASDVTGIIYEWDLHYDLVQQFSINDSLKLETTEPLYSIATINFNSHPHILAGSQSIYLVNIKTKEVSKTFPAHIQPIKSILSVPFDRDLFVSCATGDRFINLYSITKQATKSVFVTQSPVIDIDIHTSGDKSILIATTESGDVEVFNSFVADDIAIVSNSNSRKKKRQQLANSKSRHSNGTVHLVRGEDEIKGTSPNLVVVSAAIKHNALIYTWLESSTKPRFDAEKWVSEDGEVLITQKMDLLKTKSDVSVPHHALNGHDVASSKHYNEGNTVVSDGYNLNNVIESDDEEGETLAEKLNKLATDAKTITPKKTKKSGLNNNTLTTVLAQALKSNDHSLLETVLINKDQQVIQNTIARLDSALAIVLLDRLSERLARQATRFDQLVHWIKWIIIIHGGILSSLPSLASKLSNLHGILSRKANTLPRLLQLQSKMNIITDQYDLHRNNDFFNDGEDTDVEYIEEIDDANLMNDDFDSERDDYIDSDQDMDIEGEESDNEINTDDFEAVQLEEEGYSDEEIAVNNKDIGSDEE